MPKDIAICKRALKDLHCCRGWILLGLIAAALMACLQLYLPWTMKLLFDTLTGSRRASLMRVVFTLIAVGIIAGLCEGLKEHAFAQAAERILVRIRDRVYTHLRSLPLTYFQKERAGRVMSVLVLDAPAMVKFYDPVLGDGFVSMLQLLAAFTILIRVFGWLALLAPAACALYLIVPIILTPRLRLLQQRDQVLNAKLSADLQESVAATREVNAFNREQWDRHRMARTFRRFLPLRNRIGKLQIISSFNALIYWIVAGFFYWFGGRRVLAHEITLGSLFAMVWYFTFLDMPVRRLVGLNHQVQSALAAADKIFEFLDNHVAEQLGGKDHIEIKGQVTFESVQFAYEANHPVLRNVDLSVFPGERVAIVGPSGAGKSTLLSLILGLYPVLSGRILIDGRDITRISLGSLRSQVAAVFQDTFLFNTSVLENIRFAKAEATDMEALWAAKAAGVDAVAVELPRGYETEVGERGAALSGGQRQRIAIARALLLDPRILILDEATSSVDAQAETAICGALEELMKGRTTFMVAHRLSTVSKFERIIVLEQGRVIASGNHSQLIDECEWYRRNYEIQTALQTDREPPQWISPNHKGSSSLVDVIKESRLP